ncbi:Miniconductance mechanosensitive channel YbdG [termite gut metagenome]|uniref:Miniconductance mechanosensitive channel YbdG n=2 Tax=termite gut metagenome TaxID=433724 RepID=A0A5J4SFM3_9ZZZZ
MESVVHGINELLVSWGISGSFANGLDRGVLFAFMLLAAYLANVICSYFILPLITKLVQKTRVTWDDVIFDRKVMIHLFRIVSPALIYVFIPFVFPTNPVISEIIQRICKVAGIYFFICFVNAFFVAVYSIYTEKEQGHPLKGLLQTLQVILFLVGVISVVGVLINKSPMVLLATLGTSAAVLMLVFKDSIMGVVSGIQLSANRMLRVGDWITMPKYGADGTVIEVALYTVKVRNWDNTITTIPPYALISDSFQNWRGMHESGGRRVKRSINIDMNSVKFCTPEMLDKYRKIHLLTDYIEETEQVVHEHNEKYHIDNSVLVNGRRQTNLGVFRAYLSNYLKSRSDINHTMMCIVRYLHPTEKGIPVELYFFSTTTMWVSYENIQADVFDHVLAIVPEFDLRVFQNLVFLNEK